MDHLSDMLTAGLRITKELPFTSTISKTCDCPSDVLKVALVGVLSNPAITTRSSHVLVWKFELSSIDLMRKCKIKDTVRCFTKISLTC